MNVLSLFNGISCGRIALERANINVERYVSYEIDNIANNIAKKNYPNDEYYGDVFSANFEEYIGFDLLIGGSPCTYWSIARSSAAEIKRETSSSGIGWELFNQYLNALQTVKPKFFIYENNFSISKEIKEEITNRLGVDPIVIDSSLVSAQRRKRCYWTNIQNIEQPENLYIDFQNIRDFDFEHIKSYKVKRTPSRIRMWNDGLGRINGAICCDNITNKNKAGTVTSKQDRNYNAGLIEFEDFCRFLTLEEQEQLQTLPIGYTNVDGISINQRQLAIGNGWTVDVIVHLLNYIKKIE